MKLETAYRKLFRHRHRWAISISFDDDTRPVVSFELRDRSEWPEGQEPPKEQRYARGLANAMSLTADAIAQHNRVIDRYRDYRRALQEAE